MNAADALDWLDRFCKRVDLQDLGPAPIGAKNRVVLTGLDGSVVGGRNVRDCIWRAATRQGAGSNGNNRAAESLK